MTEKKKSLFSRTFILVFFIQALNGIAFSITNPIFTEYLLDRNIAFENTGYISSAISYISMCFTPFAGYLSDRISKKKILLVSYIMTTLCLFAYVFAAGFINVLAIRIIHGIAFAMTSTMSVTFATSFVPMEQLSEAISTLSIGSLISNMMAPQLGSMLTDRYSINAPFYFAGACSVIAVIMILMLPGQEQQPVQKQPAEGKRRFALSQLFAREVLIYMILISFLSYGNGLISYFLRKLGQERGISNISLFFTTTSLALIFLKPAVSRIYDRKGLAFVLYPSFVVYGIVMFVIAKARVLWLFIAASILKAASQGCATSILQVESVRTVGKEKSGIGVSTCMIGQNIGNTLGPIIGANMISASGYDFTYSFAGIMMFVAILIFFAYRMMKRKQLLKAQ